MEFRENWTRVENFCGRQKVRNTENAWLCYDVVSICLQTGEIATVTHVAVAGEGNKKTGKEWSRLKQNKTTLGRPMGDLVFIVEIQFSTLLSRSRCE